ncbi:MAG: hypothetical protein JOZ86_10695 [Candidatus Eremiobacteraeota bacterium]|nr:hypothetical protein [Candidatus Eremiobacteraeota bacterium]
MKRPAFGLLLLLIAFAPVSAALPPVAGARCYGKSLPLQANLPLGTSSPETDVIDIHVIRSADGSRIAAWYYTNRSGDRFVQFVAGQGPYVAGLFTGAAARRTAASISVNPPDSFIPVDRNDAIAFERMGRGVLDPCFSHPLGGSRDR